MKKFFLIMIALFLVFIVTSCDQADTDQTYTITIKNGMFKGEEVSTKTAKYKDILVIVPNDDTLEFVGWYEDGKLISTNKEYTFQVLKDLTIEARYETSKKLKNGYYLLEEKQEKGLNITGSYIFNAILVEDDCLTWYEVDYTGKKVQTGTITITNQTVSLNIGLKKYDFSANEDYTTLKFNNKINRVETAMTYTYQKDFKAPIDTGSTNFEDELFGDDINENFYNYCPSVMIENGTTMHIWYCSNKDSGRVVDHIAYRKGTLTSDGKWTFGEKEFVLEPTSDTWDKAHVCDPTVIKGNFNYNGEDYHYLMAYLGCATTNVTVNEVGVAVSKNPNGPFIKIDELNPIANFNQAIIEHGNTDDWKKSWGYGQPSLVSIDKAGKIMLFYTAGTPKSTHTVCEEWDLSNLNNPIRLSSNNLSPIGVTNAVGGADSINNADFAYDPATNRLICIKEDFPYPTNGETNWITGSNTLMYMELDENEETPMHTLATNTSKTWIVFGNISKNSTGYERNHNAGLVTDEYGWVLSSTKIGVVYTMSMLRTDYPDWNGSGQWPALHTYRLHGIVLDLPR